MSLLSQQIRNIIENDTTLRAKEKIVSIPTGLDIIDLSNGGVDPTNGKLDTGMREGHIIGFVGNTGTGKSTLAQQIAYDMIKPFENGTCVAFDTEKGYNKIRMMNLYTKGDASLIKRFEEQVGAPHNVDTYMDNLRTLVTNIGKFKTEHEEELMEEFIDINGDKVKVLAPTVIIVDSIASLFSIDKTARADGKVKAAETAEGETNMAGSQTAIENNSFFAKYLNIIFKSNIFLFVVGHINTKVQTDRFPKPSKIPWLAIDENIKGGTGFWYYCDYFVRINKGDNLKEDKDYGIYGFINRIQVLKSRGNTSGVVYPMVFDMARGYDNLLSDVQFLIENGNIVTGAKSYLKSMPDIKFTKSTVREVCEKNPELEQAIYNEVVEIFVARMPSIEKDGSPDAAGAANDAGDFATGEQSSDEVPTKKSSGRSSGVRIKPRSVS